jgi:hypothetical protein
MDNPPLKTFMSDTQTAAASILSNPVFAFLLSRMPALLAASAYF